MKYDGWEDVFDYKADTGEITRHGKKCGSVSNRGYLVIQNMGVKIMAGRLAWILYYGKEPEGVIDHINGDSLDNRIENLRDVTQRENMLNKKAHRQGREPGWCRRKSGKYEVYIKIDGVKTYLGQFNTSHEASSAYANVFTRIMGRKE